MPAPKPLLAGMLATASLSGAVAHVLSPTPGLAQDARYRVEGIISDSNGVPLERQQIVLIGAGDSQHQGGVGLSAPDGSFVVEVPGGNQARQSVRGVQLRIGRVRLGGDRLGQRKGHQRPGVDRRGNSQRRAGAAGLLVPARRPWTDSGNRDGP